MKTSFIFSLFLIVLVTASLHAATALPHPPIDSLSAVITPPPPDDKTSPFAILSFVLSIFTLVPYLNILALGGYLPALFHRLAKNRMKVNDTTKGTGLLKASKVISIVGFSIYAFNTLAAIVGVTVVGTAPTGMLLLVLMGAIWGFFKILGK